MGDLGIRWSKKYVKKGKGIYATERGELKKIKDKEEKGHRVRHKVSEYSGAGWSK